MASQISVYFVCILTTGLAASTGCNETQQPLEVGQYSEALSGRSELCTQPAPNRRMVCVDGSWVRPIDDCQLAGADCDAGLPELDAGLCEPSTCQDVEAECGVLDDGCGRAVDCGHCIEPDSCGGAGVANRCGAVPFALEYADPTRVDAWVESGGYHLGLDEAGGGYVSCLINGQTDVVPPVGASCPSRVGDANLVSGGFGRGWQTAIRDRQHSGRHNPTQAGFDDSHGTPTRLSRGPSCQGDGGRVYVHPFAMPIFANKKYDWVENEDITGDGYQGDGNNSDADGIDESGLSQLDEVRSEWAYSGFYEDASDLVNADVGIVRHLSQLDYLFPVDALMQFQHGVLDNGNPVLDTRAADWSDIASDEGMPEHLQGPTRPSMNDYATGIHSYSGRIRWSHRHHHVLWVDNNGAWHEGSAVECNEKYAVRALDDQFLDRFTGSGSVNSLIGGAPNSFEGQTDNALIILADGGVNEVDSSRAMGLFLPVNSPCNARQIAGVDSFTGEVIYTQDRRLRTTIHGQRRACGHLNGKPERTLWVDPDRRKADAIVENDQTNMSIQFYYMGLLAPDTLPPGIHERIRMDVYLLFGTPTEIRNAAAELSQPGVLNRSSCEVRPMCETPIGPSAP